MPRLALQASTPPFSLRTERPRWRFTASASCLLLASSLLAQSADQQAGVVNSIVPPRFSEVAIGHEDSGARAEVQANILATGLSRWAGAKASGTIAFSSGGTAVPMTYALLPGNRERLTFSDAGADEVTVVNGPVGRMQSGSKPAHWMSTSTALAGIAPLDIAEGFATPSADYSLVDHGAATLDGVSMHRISIERAVPLESLDLHKKSSYAVLDCYFDSTTHLLRKTVSKVTLPGVEGQRMLRVVTYSDFRSEGAFTLPYAIAETIEGRPTWALSITAFDISNLPTNDQF